jgi:acyl-CoA thioester hydrolase
MSWQRAILNHCRTGHHGIKSAIVSQRQDNNRITGGKSPISFSKAPIRSPVMSVEPQWIDYNGHLNLAYYQVLFDRGTDGLFAALGIDAAYAAQRAMSMFALEAHISYLREIGEGERVYVDSLILDHDAKRLHVFQSLFHADKNTVSATCEIMQLHVDMTHRRAAPFPADRLEVIAACAAAHAELPRPEQAGRRIGIPRR